MRLKLLLAVVCAAGFGASYALADNGHGHKGGDHGHGSKCSEVHVRGTVAAQSLTVTLDRGSSRLKLAPGSQVVLQLGGTGQTVRVDAEACSTTTGSAATLVAKSVELQARNTTATTTTQATTTTSP